MGCKAGSWPADPSAGSRRRPSCPSPWGDLFGLASRVLAGLSPDPRAVASGQVAFCHTRLPGPVARDQAWPPLAAFRFPHLERERGPAVRRPPWGAGDQPCVACANSISSYRTGLSAQLSREALLKEKEDRSTGQRWGHFFLVQSGAVGSVI